jgi:cytidylate kinase
MPIITIDGQIGAGAPEVGRQVAQSLGIDYYDRLLLAGVAKRVGATVGAVESKERRFHRFSDRLQSLFERALRGLAMSAGAGDPYFGVFYPESLPLTWDESPHGPKTNAHQLGSSELAKATGDQIREIADTGGAVIVHRAGCVELMNRPGTLRVGLYAPYRERVWRLMTREGFLRPHEAEQAIEERERSQVAYFKGNFGVHPHDEEIYDLQLHTSTHGLGLVALKIVHAVRDGHPLDGVVALS